MIMMTAIASYSSCLDILEQHTQRISQSGRLSELVGNMPGKPEILQGAAEQTFSAVKIRERKDTEQILIVKTTEHPT